jgi:sRNA-binding protein
MRISSRLRPFCGLAGRPHPVRDVACLIVFACASISIAAAQQPAQDGAAPASAAAAPVAQPPAPQEPSTADAANTPKPTTPQTPQQKQLADDTAKLLALANDLKAELDKSNKDTLSLSVIKKADQVEKLAHKVRDEMKAGLQN